MAKSSEEEACVVEQDDAQGIDAHQRNKGRQINTTQIGHELPDATVERFQQAVQSEPKLRYEGLAQVQNLEIDQPAHDDVRDHQKPHNVEDHQQNLQKRGHVPGLVCEFVAQDLSARKLYCNPLPQRRYLTFTSIKIR